jgi:hypothetical protein
MGNPGNIFTNALSGATACDASASAAVAPAWSDNSREGNSTYSQSAGAVRGDRHYPLRELVRYNSLKLMVSAMPERIPLFWIILRNKVFLSK